MRRRYKLFYIFLLLILSNAAHALDIKHESEKLYLSGRIANGDKITFDIYLEQLAPNSIKKVYLNSGGGKVNEAIRIAEKLRAMGVTTIVDASRNRCTSACAILFTGGVQRVYLNADRIEDGLYKPREKLGLGFHEASLKKAGKKRKTSNRGTNRTIKIFEKFGVPRAGDIIVLAPPNRMYHISGETALKMGIATKITQN